MTRTALALVAALALGAAGCGGGGSTSTTSSAPASTTAQTGASGASGGGAVAIKMQNIQFAPKDQTVKVGQKVTWTNGDTVAHNVTATSGAGFKSADFGQGGTFSFTPTKAGTIKYTCTLHPGMNGTLTVQR